MTVQAFDDLPLYRRAGDEVRQWLKALAFSHFATFNFNSDATLYSGRKALKDFLARWDRRVLGRRFNEKPREMRTLKHPAIRERDPVVLNDPEIIKLKELEKKNLRYVQVWEDGWRRPAYA